MTVREIQSHLEEMYGTEVSPTLISSVTDAVIDEVKAWQSRPLDAIYPIVYLDCIHVKVRDGSVRVKAVYLAIGINMSGEKEVMGLWIAQTEGAKFWLQVVTELKNRGVQDIFIACVDGLKGFPEAIEAVYPHAAVQLCIVHMVRNSLNYVSWKMRAEVAAGLKRIYTCATVDEAEQMLGGFEDKWDDAYLPISQSWRRNWSRIIPFFDYTPEIRKVIHVTARQLLRQCTNGKLLGDAEKRACSSPPVLHPSPSRTGNYRIHRNLLQPLSASFSARLSVTS